MLKLATANFGRTLGAFK